MKETSSEFSKNPHVHEASLQASRMYIKLPGIKPHEVCLYIWSFITETKEYCEFTAISANRSTWLLQFHLECDFFFLFPLFPSVRVKETLTEIYAIIAEWCYSAGTAIYWRTMESQPASVTPSPSCSQIPLITCLNVTAIMCFFVVVVFPVRVLFSMFSLFPSFIQRLPVQRCLFSHSLAIAAVGSSWISGVSYTNA